jgi:hypothetical protein
MWQTNHSMLPLDDPRWKILTGGYRVPYDVSVPLGKLFEQGESKELWDELWQELHHQGDIGPASYAAVPTSWSLHGGAPGWTGMSSG